MFQIHTVQNSEKLLKYFHLSNETVHCKIFPNLGASLQQFSIGEVDIIQGIEPKESELPYFRRYYPSVFLFPFPGRIAGGKYEYDGKVYQLSVNETSKGNAIHGFLAEASFELIEQELKNDSAILNFQYSYLGHEKGFPFPADINIIYEVSNSSLNITMRIKNIGDHSFPFGLGWHPYFLAKNLAESELKFQSDLQLTNNENQIPTGTKLITFKSTIGNQILDDTYLLNDSKIHFSTEEYQMSMNTFSTQENFLQLYIPPDRKSIAIEPMTCAPDVFNYRKGLLKLGSKLTYDWKIQIDFKLS